MSRRCEKCGGEDAYVRFRPKGDVIVTLHSFGTPDVRRDNLPAGCSAPDWYVRADRDVLHVHCSTCQWWWVEDPAGAPVDHTDALAALERVRCDRDYPGFTADIATIRRALRSAPQRRVAPACTCSSTYWKNADPGNCPVHAARGDV